MDPLSTPRIGFALFALLFAFVLIAMGSGENGPFPLRSVFAVTPLTSAAALLLSVAGVAVVAWKSSRTDRDQPGPVVAEYESPEHLRPAELALLVHERLQPRDAVATIVDLALRGFLAVEPIHAEGGSGHEWKLLRLRHDVKELEEFEEDLLAGLFARAPQPSLHHQAVRLVHETTLSALATSYFAVVDIAWDSLYRSAVKRGWFVANPGAVWSHWVWTGATLMYLGVVGGYFLGAITGGGLAGLALVSVGIAVIRLGGGLPNRTSRGRELFRRALGFRLYLDVAEGERERTAERAALLAPHLPYAIAFDLADQWTNALHDLYLPGTASLEDFAVHATDTIELGLHEKPRRGSF